MINKEENTIFDEVNLDDMESDYFESPFYIEDDGVYVDNDFLDEGHNRHFIRVNARFL